jgi:hypothetical protein
MGQRWLQILVACGVFYAFHKNRGEGAVTQGKLQYWYDNDTGFDRPPSTSGSSDRPNVMTDVLAFEKLFRRVDRGGGESPIRT